MDDQLHQGASAKNRHRFYRDAVWPHNHGRIANATADNRVARANLFCDVDTAARALELHLQPFGFVIAFGLRQHPGPESR